MTVTVRRTVLEVWITPAPTEEEPDPEPVLDATAYAATCSFGFDQRYAEATVRRTGGGTIGIGYWSPVEIKMSCFPGAYPEEDGVETRFRGYVVPIDNAAYPIENVLHCKGRLYRAAWVRNNQPGGTDFAPPGGEGATDQSMVVAVLTACGVPHNPASIDGTGLALGSVFVDLASTDSIASLTAPGPFTWGEQQSGLDFIEQLDEVCVAVDAGTPGRFRTIESLGGTVYRFRHQTVPDASVSASFTEGVDVLEARISRDPAGSANRVTVTGAPDPVPGVPTDLLENGGVHRFTVASAFAPYLPPGLPVDPGTVSAEFPEGFPTVTVTFSSPLIEKSTIAQPGDVLSCQALADFLLGEANTVTDVLELATPRDDLLGPGQSIHLDSPRLGLTDPDRHYWLQHLEMTVDERGAFTQRLRCLRKS